MAKGFGTKLQQLGYVALIYPEDHSYAARNFMDLIGGEPFMDLTNILEDAHCWKSLNDAIDTINLYMSFIIHHLEEGDEGTATVQIQRIKRLNDGALQTKLVRELTFFIG